MATQHLEMTYLLVGPLHFNQRLLVWWKATLCLRFLISLKTFVLIAVPLHFPLTQGTKSQVYGPIGRQWHI